MSKHFSYAFLILLASTLSGCNTDTDTDRAYQLGVADGKRMYLTQLIKQQNLIDELNSSQDKAAFNIGCSASWSCSFAQRIRKVPPVPADRQFNSQLLQHYTKIFRIGDGLFFGVMFFTFTIGFLAFLRRKLFKLVDEIRNANADLMSLKEDYKTQYQNNLALAKATDDAFTSLKTKQTIKTKIEESIAGHEKTKARLEKEVIDLRKQKLFKSETPPIYNNGYSHGQHQIDAKGIFGSKPSD